MGTAKTPRQPYSSNRRVSFTLAGLRGKLVPSRRILRWRGIRDSAQESRLYQASWVLVHFLFDRDAERFNQLQERLARGGEPEKAWNATFPEWSLAEPGATE